MAELPSKITVLGRCVLALAVMLGARAGLGEPDAIPSESYWRRYPCAVALRAPLDELDDA